MSLPPIIPEPVTDHRLHLARVSFAFSLRYDWKMSFKDIRRVMNLSGPDQARQLVAKAVRIRRERLKSIKPVAIELPRYQR